MFLIVDDDPDYIDIYKEIISEKIENREYCIFNCGNDLIEFLKTISLENQLPKFIISDLKMPEINGFDILQYIQTNNLLMKIPVIILATSMWKEDKKKAFEMGCFAFFHKSDSFSELKHLMEKILSDHSS